MKIFVYDTKFVTVGYLDVAKSIIWTDRFDEAGDFELYLEPTAENMSIFKQDYYLTNDLSDSVMIIEDVQLLTSIEDGDELKIAGRSLASLLNRRIVWKQTEFDAGSPIQSAIKSLLTPAFMDKSNYPDRYISNFKFINNSALNKLPRFSDVDVESEVSASGAQYTGDNIYDVVLKLCSATSIGMKVYIDDKWNFNFYLYSGEDRSYDNKKNNPYVVFSPEWENIVSVDFLTSTKTLKSVTLVAGEGEGNKRKTCEVKRSKNTTGITRRELFTDARDLSSNYQDSSGNQKSYSSSQYNNLLKQRGKEKLALKENQKTNTFAGEVDAVTTFVYGRDFFLGDIVQLVDKFGNGHKARISEIIFSWDTSTGYKVYPTFKIIEEED